jgi:signal transduction histidine kinase
LLNNAIQHTEDDGVITILTEEETDHFIITIQDNGKGIPPEDLPHIFERFFRGDRSRSHARDRVQALVWRLFPNSSESAAAASG